MKIVYILFLLLLFITGCSDNIKSRTKILTPDSITISCDQGKYWQSRDHYTGVSISATRYLK